MSPLTLAAIDGSEIALVAIVASFSFVLGAFICMSVASVAKSRHREESRREIAAYVAEGSISPQDAAVLLSAEPDQVRKRVAEGLAWGTLSAKGAERLLRASDGGGGAKPAAS